MFVSRPCFVLDYYFNKQNSKLCRYTLHRLRTNQYTFSLWFKQATNLPVNLNIKINEKSIIMEEKKIIQVLSACRQLIKMLTAFNKKNDWCVLSFDILLTFIIYIGLFVSCLITISVTWFCFDHAFDLVRTSLAMTMGMSGIVSLLCLIFLIKNENFISETIDFLQNIVEKRKCLL